jgi:hypothetical protein
MQIDAPSFGVGVRPVALNIIYPVGSGPSTPTGAGNVYHLLANIYDRSSQPPEFLFVSLRLLLYQCSPHDLNSPFNPGREL